MNPTDKYRKKLLEALVFFVKKLKRPTKTVMFKLLAELDFRHFAQTGLTVTNLEYEVWKYGPVPRTLYNEITQKGKVAIPEDFEKALSYEKKEYIDTSDEERVEFKFHSKRNPDLSVFSPRQIKIMEEMADIYKYAGATISSKASHERDKPWFKAI
jgi:uncharacterized phage-associated protein